ncbi:MAG: Pyruvate kinase [uncultured Gemmatimonadaceae bacterium]|uniref:Pyruvate kinase n=1 Tax=uncultured Gemmatimonadaceae bacterium TaxID=246130 RepID=A0A6J4MHY4_9BACT|nr:MAG: Pyruvate kinase [uncultured Gemmatimonadaceae bacterium]
MSTHHPRTKIVCTLGPASNSREGIRTLMEAGMNVARVNFSHGTHEQHAATVRAIREVADELGRPVAILGDLQGPRIRIGDLPETREIRPGEDLVLVSERETVAPGEIPVTYTEIASDVHVGDRILVNDGLLELVVLEVAPPRVTARVVHGGPLKSHKGMNFPGISLSVPSITEKDEADIEFAVRHDLDYLALSFVRRAEDILDLKSRIPHHLLVVAKIEKDVALTNIESILRASDGVMVARGDLGVELPFEEVPIAQKRIIATAGRLGRPVITATQMLESMVENPRPTRAEASDVANAILDGTDAAMLSAETAAGRFPRLACEAMRRIIVEIESHPAPHFLRDERRTLDGSASTEETIAAATVAAVRMLRAPVVIVFTKSGFSARIVSAHRPNVPILALTDDPRTYRQLALVWGVIPELVPHRESYEDMVAAGHEAVKRRGLAAAGSRVIVTAGVPFDVPGTTNLLKVETVQ